MKEFKKQFDSVTELVSYFLSNGINLSTPCKIEINSIYDWVSDSNFEHNTESEIVEPIKNNSLVATPRTLGCND